MARGKKEVQRELSQSLSQMRNLQDDPGKVEELRSMRDTVENLTDELNQINIEEAAERAIAGIQFGKDVQENARQFSFCKFIREASEGKLSGVELEMSELAKEEARQIGGSLMGVGIPSCVLQNRRDFAGMTAGSKESGGYTIATQLQYNEALRARLVLAKAGARFISGLTGNISVVNGESIVAKWEGENKKTEDQKKLFSARNLSPKRLSVSTPISKQLIIQSSWDVEKMVVDDILNAHATALEEAAINGSGEGQPLGILNTANIGCVEMGENGGPATFQKMVDLETVVSIRNADLGSLSYITNSKVRGALKTTLKANGVPGYIWEKNEVNGYSALASNILPSDLRKGAAQGLSCAIFGNFNDLLIFQWGGLDLTIDNLTLADEAAIKVTLNAYHDIFLRYPESFAAIKDIVA